MARLPQPGGDANTWGTVLNDYLSTSHNTDGTLKDNVVGTGTLDAGSPTSGQVLTYDGAGLSWSTTTASGSVPDATSSVKGLVQLAGDLGGTSASPTVPGLAAKADTSALNLKADASALTSHTSNTSNPHSVTKAQVGLGNVDNTTDANKPVSSATQTALNLKANLASPTFTGTVTVPTPTNPTDAATKTYVDTTVSAGTPDANSTTKGKIQLTGDLGGTAASPTVPGLSGKANTSHVHSGADITSGTVPTSALTGTAALATTGGQETVSTQNATGATTLNLANGNVFNVTLTGNATFTFSGATSGKACSFALYKRQDATGSRTVTWPASVRWSGGAPTLTTTANSIDILVFESIDGGTTWFGSLVGANFS